MTDEITEPGVYNMPDDVYHADPVPGGSLSSSGARKLLPPNCPAVFAYERENPPGPSDTFSFGHAAHKLALGAGPDLEVVDADSWRTKDAKEAKKEALAAGKVPLLAADHAEVLAMVDALRAHPIASALLNPELGHPERSLFWTDDKTGVWMRARLDWLPNPTQGRMVIPDYKTAASADPWRFAKAAADYGYHQQAAWYLDGIRSLGLDVDPAFVFIAQEKRPPFLVSVVELDQTALRIGEALNRQAIETYVSCLEAGEWPGYSDDVELVSLPSWYVRLNDMGEEQW